jgi:DNA-binding transcriptional LysR family regulator
MNIQRQPARPAQLMLSMSQVEVVHLSQSALSRSIQVLEHELGAPLFDRVGQSLHLTPFGKLVRRRADRVLFETREITRELALLKTGEVGQIALGLTPTPAALLLDAAIMAFARFFPRVQVKFYFNRTAELIEGLRSEAYDIAIVDGTALPVTEGLDVEPLPAIPAGFYCRKGHPLARKKRVTISELREFPIACSPLSDFVSQTMVRQLGPEAHPERLFTISCDSYAALCAAMSNSDLVISSVSSLFTDALASRSVVELEIMPHIEIAGVYAIVRLAGRTHSPALDAIAEIARRRIRPDPANEGSLLRSFVRRSTTAKTVRS